ncbi:MAG: biosynthetic-type acetolactate synthase large subunit [Candidatus Schekmanbacteria bacterium]|nr:biosynthetic-type acetolactate synthase large subunit [Candidatus Schekmanbacteria bacterium]
MKKNGASIIIESLIQNGVNTVFGYPGGANIPIYDALYGHQGIRHILTRHEQGAIHAADGFARATGKLGVVFATSGPGATNLVTGLANAYMDSVPLVAITGQVPTHMIGNDSFQEADIYGITVPITKYNYLVKDVSKMGQIMAEAIHIATTGRPGPVLIDVPKDIQDMSAVYGKYDVRLPSYKPNVKGNTMQINEAIKAIDTARRPVIYAGGGIITSSAVKELVSLSRKGNIPVVLTLMALGSMPSEEDLNLGMVGMHGTKYANLAVRECDLLIAVGARFDDRVTGNPDNFAQDAKIIHIDIDPAEIGKIKQVEIPIVGDAKTVLGIIAEKVKSQPRKEWVEKIKKYKKDYPLKYKHSDKKVIKPQQVIEAVNDVIDGDAIFVTDVGQHQMWAAQYLKLKESRTFISSGGLGTMGFGFPASIGAVIGRPDKTVINITGDGSFQMTIQEMATAAHYKLPIKVVLINNGFLGMVRQWQQLFLGKRYSYTDLGESPDFVKIAEGYGVKGIKIEKPDEVKPAIEKALKHDGMVLLDFRVEREENVMPMIPAGGSIETIME